MFKRIITGILHFIVNVISHLVHRGCRHCDETETKDEEKGSKS